MNIISSLENGVNPNVFPCEDLKTALQIYLYKKDPDEYSRFKVVAETLKNRMELTKKQYIDFLAHYKKRCCSTEGENVCNLDDAEPLFPSKN